MKYETACRGHSKSAHLKSSARIKTLIVPALIFYVRLEKIKALANFQFLHQFAFIYVAIEKPV